MEMCQELFSLLSSRAFLAPYNDESVDALQQRHPSPPENLQLPPSPDFSTPGLEVCAENQLGVLIQAQLLVLTGSVPNI